MSSGVEPANISRGKRRRGEHLVMHDNKNNDNREPAATRPDDIDPERIKTLFADLDPIMHEAIDNAAWRSLKLAATGLWAESKLRLFGAIEGVLEALRRQIVGKVLRWLCILVFGFFLVMQALTKVCLMGPMGQLSFLLRPTIGVDVCKVLRDSRLVESAPPKSGSITAVGKWEKNEFREFLYRSVTHYSNVAQLNDNITSIRWLVTETTNEVEKVRSWIRRTPHMFGHAAIEDQVETLYATFVWQDRLLSKYHPSLEAQLLGGKQRVKALDMASKKCLQLNKSLGGKVSLLLRFIYQHCDFCRALSDEGQLYIALVDFLEGFIEEIHAHSEDANNIHQSVRTMYNSSIHITHSLDASMARYQKECIDMTSSASPFFSFGWFSHAKELPQACRVDPTMHLARSKDFLRNVETIVDVSGVIYRANQDVMDALTGIAITAKSQLPKRKRRLEADLPTGGWDASSSQDQAKIIIDRLVAKDDAGLLGSMERLLPYFDRLLVESKEKKDEEA